MRIIPRVLAWLGLGPTVHLPRPEGPYVPVTYEIVAEALDNSRENTEDGWPWRCAVSDVVEDLMLKCADVEDADPEVVRTHVERYLAERRP